MNDSNKRLNYSFGVIDLRLILCRNVIWISGRMSEEDEHKNPIKKNNAEYFYHRARGSMPAMYG